MSKIWRAILVKENPVVAETHGVVDAVMDTVQGAVAIICRKHPGHRIVEIWQRGEMRDGIEYKIDVETGEMRPVDVGNVCGGAETIREGAGEFDHNRGVGSDSASETNNAGSPSIHRRRTEEALFRISDQRLAEMRKSANAAQSAPDSGFRRRATD